MKLGSIRNRFILATVLTTLVAVLASATAMIFFNLRDYRATTLADVSAQANLLARAVAPALRSGDRATASSYMTMLQEQPRILAAAIFNREGQLFASYNPTEDIPRSTKEIPLIDGSEVEGDTLVVFRRILVDRDIIGFVFVRMEYSFWQKLLGNIAIALAGILLAMLTAFLVSMQSQKAIVGPMRSITTLARRFIETKDYSLRADFAGEGEVAYLVDAINEMLDEVEAGRRAQEATNRQLASEVHDRRLTEQSLRRSETQVRQLNTELEERVQERTLQYEVANKELESFSYSVSHDLRSPLRAIDGFSQALLEDYEDQLDEAGKNYLLRVRAAAQRMGALIDDMLKLSRVSRGEISFQEVDISRMAQQIFDELREENPNSNAQLIVTPKLKAICDPHLLRIALTNLIGNAWKYSAKNPKPVIEFGRHGFSSEPVFFVQDNGIGFDMNYADKLFGAFQRMQNASDFAGTGIGLATAKRVIARHGGRIWANAEPGRGAVFYFTLPPHELSNSATIGESNEYQADTVG